MRTRFLATICISIVLSSMLNSCSSCSEEKRASLGSEYGTTEEYFHEEDQNVRSYLPIFNDVETVISTLSKNGIGKLGRWKNDMFGWISMTDYFILNEPSTADKMGNNIAYYLESNTEHCIEELKLVLNINDTSEEQRAIDFFKKTSKKTFESLSLTIPDGLMNSISKGETYNNQQPEFTVAFEVTESNISTYTLSISAETHQQ